MNDNIQDQVKNESRNQSQATTSSVAQNGSDLINNSTNPVSNSGSFAGANQNDINGQQSAPLVSDQGIPASWIEIKDGKFVCSECENENVPETNTAEGVVSADIPSIKAKFENNPGTKLTIYGICPICGMEFEFRSKNGTLYLEPSSMTK